MPEKATNSVDRASKPVSARKMVNVPNSAVVPDSKRENANRRVNVHTTVLNA